MTKRTQATPQENDTNVGGMVPGETNEGGAHMFSDFDVEQEYKSPPLVPQGQYHAVITDFKMDWDMMALVINFCLHDNGGVMNDGETPLDGSYQYGRVFFPKPGDENEPTKDGKMNKRQAKINMIERFSRDTGLVIKNNKQLAEALDNKEWIGYEIDVVVGIREWEGRLSNEIKQYKKSTL